MSENHGEQQQQQQNEQQNIAPPFSPVLIEESKQNSTDYSDYSDDSDAPQSGTLAALYRQRHIALKAAQKRTAEKEQAMKFDDPKIERNIEILAKKTEELKRKTKEQHLVDGPVERPPPPPGARPPINGITPILPDENPQVGFKKHAQKGPAGAFTDDAVPSSETESDDDGNTVHILGILPPAPAWMPKRNEYGDPPDTEYEAIDIIGQMTKDKEIWYNVVFKEEKFGHKTHWCKESDCENCPQLIEEWKKKQQKKNSQIPKSQKSKPKSHDSDPSSASLSSSSSSTEDCTPPPESESSSSSSTEDFTPPPENSSSSSTEDFTPEPESSSSDSRSDLESCD